MPTLFITGASRGIGLEFVRQYLMDGWIIHASARNLKKADSLMSLSCLHDRLITVHEVDVTDKKQINNVSHELRDQPIDILINNAGMWAGDKERFGQFTNANLMEQFHCHVFGTMAICEAFLEHLKAGEKKLIVNISSGNGSFGWPKSVGNYPYDTSKAALNFLTKALSNDLKDLGITVVSLTPGYVTTDMSGPNADLEPKESVNGMRSVINGLTPELTGSFFRYNGEYMPW